MDKENPTKQFEEMRWELIENPQLKETPAREFGYMVRKDNELFKIIDLPRVKAFYLEEQKKELISKIETLQKMADKHPMNGPHPDYNKGYRAALNASLFIIKSENK